MNDIGIEQIDNYEIRLKKLTDDPSLISKLCGHIANGGSMINLCDMMNVRYSDIHQWIYKDKERSDQFESAVKGQSQWVVDRILQELRDVSFSDIRKLYSSDGRLLPMDNWPDDVAKMVACIDVEEPKFDRYGNEIQGIIKKVKLVDKLKSIEMLGKNLNLFTDKVKIEGKVTLEDLVNQSMKEESGDAKEDQAKE